MVPPLPLESSSEVPSSNSSPVSRRVARIAHLGTIGFGAALGLIALGFLTNPRPYPYYRWATLPITPLPTQPRLGHYPLSVTVGTWLWEFTFPLSLIWLVDRHSLASPRARRTVLVLLPAVYALGFHLYCRFVFPQPTPSVWEPAVTAVCYVYCQNYDLTWSYITLGTVGLGIADVLTPNESTVGWYALVGFGVLTFPLGIAPLYEASLRRRDLSLAVSSGGSTTS